MAMTTAPPTTSPIPTLSEQADAVDQILRWSEGLNDDMTNLRLIYAGATLRALAEAKTPPAFYPMKSGHIYTSKRNPDGSLGWVDMGPAPEHHNP